MEQRTERPIQWPYMLTLKLHHCIRLKRGQGEEKTGGNAARKQNGSESALQEPLGRLYS